MADPDDIYATLEEVKVQDLDLDAADTADDARIELCIRAASRAVDERLGTRFYVKNEARKFTAKYDGYIRINHFLTVTTLKTDDDGDGTLETTWAAADFTLYPINAALDAEPYHVVKPAVGSTKFFPKGRDGVEVTADFGWSKLNKLPALIKFATRQQAMRWFSRKDVIFGLAGPPELGVEPVVIPKLDPDVEMALSSFHEPATIGVV